VFLIVLGELSDWQPVSPVSLHVINVQPEKLFQLLIDLLHQTICLGMIGHAEGCLHTE
jgi:hypothetical protein